AVSCTRELLQQVAGLARSRGVMVHTHASENKTECALVEADTGLTNIAYLNSLGLTGRHVALAHCVHVNEEEMNILAETGTNVAHCPSSNLKLGSGIAPIAEYLARGISVSLGADGAACNNRLDMFTEMRSAALLQKVLRGPEVLAATQALRMATINGATALGLESEIGSLEVGKRADVIVVNLNDFHLAPKPADLVSGLVYSAQASDVRTVIIDGKLVLDDTRLVTLDEAKTLKNAEEESQILLRSAGG
ncbi:MAG TPA: amidohydrolase family protein, partial [Pyrinomonadaceae bacterium]|nr:amidohydrolase family protein [Pyrinomonadaceae bacterium]